VSAPSQASQHSEPLPSNVGRDWLSCLSTGFLYYYLTSMMVVVAAVLGHDLLPRAKHAVAKSTDALHAFANWDGE
jgi:hypothetical protein